MGFRCRHVSKTFASRGGEVRALDDINLEARSEEFLCVVGPSGCGKTTLLKILAGLLEPSSGEIAFDGSPPNGRPRTAMVFQEHGLFPWMTLADNVAFGLEPSGVGRSERRARAVDFLGTFGLRGFADRFPHELSVGMRQRGGIARAFLSGRDILLMDEPLGSLDAQTKLVVQQELLRIWKEHRKLVVYVTHDIREAVLLGDRVVVLSGRPGRIREEIPVTLERPRGFASLERTDAIRIVRHVWDLLEDEVQNSLCIPA